MDKPSKAHNRLVIFILGIFMLGVIVLIPFSVSYAEGIGSHGMMQGFSETNNADTC